DDDAALTRLELRDVLAVLDQRDDLAGGSLGVVAEELGRAELFLQLEPQGRARILAGAGRGLPRLGALALHGGGEPLGVDADAAGFQRVLGEVEGKAIS